MIRFKQRNISTNYPNKLTEYTWTQPFSGDQVYIVNEFVDSVAAFSVRKINENYLGNSIRIRRFSDNVETNIGFINDDLDTSTINSFCSGTDCFVTTWYDQSGYGNNATQTTALQQPKIYDSVSGIYLENSRPSIFFDNNQLYINNFSLVFQPVTYFFVAKGQSTTRAGMLISKNSFFASTTSDFPFVISLKDTFISASVSRGNDYSADAVLTRNTNGNLQVYSVFQSITQLGVGIDSNFSGITSVTQSANTRLYSIGKASAEVGGGVNGSGFKGFLSELIIYPFTQSVDRINIESNMKTYYNIP